MGWYRFYYHPAQYLSDWNGICVYTVLFRLTEIIDNLHAITSCKHKKETYDELNETTDLHKLKWIQIKQGISCNSSC